MAVYNNLPVPGGGASTLLWENASQNANFAEQTITLGSSVTDFSILRIVYKISTTVDTEFTADTFFDNNYGNYVSGGNTGRISIGYHGNTYSYYRECYFDDSDFTKMKISTAYQLNHAGANASLVIPLQIYGIK